MNFLHREGLKDLNISNNRLGERGLWHLVDAVRSNDSLTTLDVSNCRLNVPGVGALADALKENSKIRNFNIGDNGLTDEQYRTITAETTANGILVLLRTKPHAVDTGVLSDPVTFVFSP
jgi:Ran GTPase-activating protein (RanGAP) involved in mRNA processing and transport